MVHNTPNLYRQLWNSQILSCLRALAVLIQRNGMRIAGTSHDTGNRHAIFQAYISVSYRNSARQDSRLRPCSRKRSNSTPQAGQAV
jgi:hypothetical protein